MTNELLCKKSEFQNQKRFEKVVELEEISSSQFFGHSLFQCLFSTKALTSYNFFCVHANINKLSSADEKGPKTAVGKSQFKLRMYSNENPKLCGDLTKIANIILFPKQQQYVIKIAFCL